MRIIPPDHARRIDLPGVGPCPRPVDIDQAVTGFADLVSLRVYDFAEGSVIEGEAEEDEVLVVLLAGAVSLAVTGAHAGANGAAFTLQAEGDWAIYLPPRHHYRLEPMAPATVAYARARPRGAASNTPGPRAFAPVAGVLAIEERAERLRLRMIPLAGEVDASAGLDEGLERLAHVTGPGRVVAGGTTTDLGAMDTIVLAPGEGARIEADEAGGDLLVVAALRPPA
jgi:hypothetical protein